MLPQVLADRTTSPLSSQSWFPFGNVVVNALCAPSIVRHISLSWTSFSNLWNDLFVIWVIWLVHRAEYRHLDLLPSTFPYIIHCSIPSFRLISPKNCIIGLRMIAESLCFMFNSRSIDALLRRCVHDIRSVLRQQYIPVTSTFILSLGLRIQDSEA